MPVVADFKKSLTLGAIFGAVFYLLGWLLGMIGINPTQLFSLEVPLATGVTSGLGQEVFQFFQGNIPFNLMSLLFTMIAGVVIVYIGFLLYGFLPKGKSDIGKTWLILMYGTLAVGLVLLGISGMFNVMTILGLAIYYLLASLVVVNLLKVKA